MTLFRCAVTGFSLVSAVLPALAAAQDPRPVGSTAQGTVALPPGLDLPVPPPAVARRVAGLIERIRLATNPAEREEYIADLVDTGPAALRPVFAEMERRSPATWGVMAYALGAIGDPRAIPVLRRELAHATGIVYMEILHSLTLAGDPEALPLALRSSNATTSFAPEATAIDFIAGVTGPSAVPLLVREIPRRAQEARIAALGALGTLCDPAAVPFLLEWSRQPGPADRRHALMALARIGDVRAGPRFVEALSDPDPAVREAAAEGAGYLREAAAVPALVQALATPAASRGALRGRAIWSLGLIGGPDAAAALARTLADAGEPERALILRSLGNTGEESAVVPLGREALAPNAFLATTAVRALAGIPGDASRERLLAACSDAPAHEAGLEAARELVMRRDPRAMPCVLQQLRLEIDRRHGLDPVAEDLLTHLPLAAPSSMASSLEAAAEEIRAPALQHRIIEGAQLIRLVEEQGRTIEPWIRVLENGTPGELELAILRLGELGDARAVEPLKNLFGRIEPERAWRIPEALGRIGSERVVSFLVQLLTDDTYRVPSLRRAREEAARAIARFSKSPYAADALRRAFEAERGRLFVPLLAYARVRGAEGIPELLRLKALLLRRRGSDQVLRHEKINWAIRLLRAGREIPLDEIRDVS